MAARWATDIFERHKHPHHLASGTSGKSKLMVATMAVGQLTAKGQEGANKPCTYVCLSACVCVCVSKVPGLPLQETLCHPTVVAHKSQ